MVGRGQLLYSFPPGIWALCANSWRDVSRGIAERPRGFGTSNGIYVAAAASAYFQSIHRTNPCLANRCGAPAPRSGLVWSGFVGWRGALNAGVRLFIVRLFMNPGLTRSSGQLRGARAPEQAFPRWSARTRASAKPRQFPATVISASKIDPVRVLPRRSTSLPTAAMFKYMSFKLEATVISSTGY